ncbi:hypothetical protein VNO77_19404 [Canavalia gladiata]|uniref:Beta-defensin n=1 Tax=Canavalia gladiata TaxID=3824 RepID=A0AAN9LR98_CANGL
MVFHVYRPFFFGILCIALVLTSGPATCLDLFPPMPIECIGPCAIRCNERCVSRGNLVGDCYGTLQCCCRKKP